MMRLTEIFVGMLALTAVTTFTTVANSQQSIPIPNSSVPSSSVPFSSGVSQPGNFTAAAKASEVVYNHSTVRLISGEYVNGVWSAGVEIALAPGWKTYWRVPGDAGVPSEFVWDNSSNVKSAKVFWPAPKRYEDITGKSIGYKKRVVFPVNVTAKDKDKPAKLDLQLYYAICSDICIPAQANLALTLPLQLENIPAMALLDEFASKVPKPGAKGLTVSKTEVVVTGDKTVLAVTLTGKVDPKTDILVEGFEEGYFNAPKLAGKKDGKQIFHLSVDGVKNPSELSGKTLKLTILSGEIRLETTTKVN